MFKKVISQPRFWRSVVLLGIIYMGVLMLLQWALMGFDMRFFTSRDPWIIASVFIAGSFVCGFSVTYARFWAKLKNDDRRR